MLDDATFKTIIDSAPLISIDILLKKDNKILETLGGVILEQHQVNKLEITSDRVSAIHTAQGRLSADSYIVTAGAWSQSLLGEHALNIDIRPIRG
jgi:glycine oxidase